MLNKAIEKLKSEMAEQNDNPYVQVIGNFLVDYLNKNEGAAVKVLDREKSIFKSIDIMANEAYKKKKGKYAVLTDQEGFEIVLKYFGVNEGFEYLQNVAKVDNNSDIDFDIKLENLL